MRTVQLEEGLESFEGESLLKNLKLNWNSRQKLNVNKKLKKSSGKLFPKESQWIYFVFASFRDSNWLLSSFTLSKLFSGFELKAWISSEQNFPSQARLNLRPQIPIKDSLCCLFRGFCSLSAGERKFEFLPLIKECFKFRALLKFMLLVETNQPLLNMRMRLLA